MSGSKSPNSPPKAHDIDALAKNNPLVDREKVREAQRLVETLRKEGLGGPSYEIVSPYERRPMTKRQSSAKRI